MSKINVTKEPFIPALGADWATRFYDPVVRATTKEFEFKLALVEQADLHENQTILDLGCGTGTLSIGIKRRFPKIQIYAVDGDAKILQIAEEKAKKYESMITFRESYSDALPFSEGVFDHAFSTLLFHHLTLETKVKTLKELLRVMKSGGSLNIADYGKPANISQKAFSKVIKLVDGDETTKDNFAGRLKNLIEETGFTKVETTQEFRTILGTIRLFHAQKS